MVNRTIAIPKIPIVKTAIEWGTLYEDEFKNIFNDAYIDPLIPYLGETAPYNNLYIYFIAKQYNRLIMPEMETTDEANINIINAIRNLIMIRSNSLKYKYDMLASTMPTDIGELYKNYNMSREYTDVKEYDTGTVTNSGTDATFNNVNIKTQEFTTTGDNASPRLKGESTRQTIPQTKNADQNSMQTTYGHVITSNPGDETRTFTQTASGYYGAASKAKLIEEIRALLNLNLIDDWLNDMMPVFTLHIYKNKTPAQFGVL